MQTASAIFEPFFFEAPPGADAPHKKGADAPHKTKGVTAPTQKKPVRLRAARFAADSTVPPRGVCVLLNGQTEFIEKYFEVIDELRSRGFTVATFDWRGQGGSDRLLTDDSRKGYVTDFAEYDEDLAAFMTRIVAPMGTQKPVALAHSMGGHNLLRYLAVHPDAVARAVLTAPMVAVSFRGYAAWMVALITATQTRLGRGGAWVWGMEARDPHKMNFTSQMVTSDETRFARAQAILRDQPALRLAGATWEWLAAAMRSMAWLKTQAPRITTKLLVIGAGKDRIVMTAQTKAFAARLPQACYIEFADAGHELLMERDAIRTEWWRAVDSFLAPENTMPR